MTTLIEIPGCSVSQFLPGNADIPLSDGPLALVKADTRPDVFTLVCGTSAFALKSNTSFFTHADSPRLYFFTPDLGTGSGTYIKVVLPEGVVEPNSEAEKQRDQFESILVDSGFLKDAPISTEMIARGITDQSAAVAAAIQARTSEYTSSNPSSKTIIDDDTKSTVESAKQFTSDSANWTHNAVETVNSYISAAGESVARAMGIDKSINLPEEEKSEVRKQVEDGLSQAKDGFSDIGSGISDGASQIYSSATANAHKAIDHTHGSEAADVASKAGETAKNVGSVAADGAMMASTMVHGVTAGQGAARAANTDTSKE